MIFAASLPRTSAEYIDCKNVSTPAQVHAPWWNYLSIGIDAESAWGFAHLRETRPNLARSRGQNMAWYAWYSCASGWFCPGSYALQDRIVVELQVGVVLV